ncbi:hypothetical protein C7W88_11185 [Novosphingobium sp. THN1]|uniref:hypothetical protein n=1 Tax=unclassified Novosphingobium TaxID=2644732 RepID=UPI000E495256|nr:MULTISPECIES: hypothetical protein [unclassified Novosphingobium]AXU19471.1 hypothetical protein C7W88_11185 [Novosphingobium sp. THN1]NLR40143.1 hypothetical protein [Novosphingobium sp. ERW19]
MKTMLSLLAATTAVAMTTAPAQAQTVTTGTVNVTGSVLGRCSVVAPGGSATQAFTGTIALGALDAADGTLATGFTNTTSAASGGTPVATRVVCTSASVSLAIVADRLSTAAAAVSGYSNEIDYTAEMQVALAAGGNGTVTYSTAAGATAANSATVGRLAASGNNIAVKAYGFSTRGGASNLLVAGNYTSTITVNIQPVA